MSTTRRSFFDHSAISRVSAYALLLDGKPAGRILIGHPRSGGGTVHAFVEITAGPLRIERHQTKPVPWTFHHRTGRCSGDVDGDRGALAVRDAAVVKGDAPVTMSGWVVEFERHGYAVFQVC